MISNIFNVIFKNEIRKKKHRDYMRKYYRSSPERRMKVLETNKNWALKNKDKANKIKKNYTDRNRKKHNKRCSAWYRKNIPKVRQYQRDKIQKDPNYKIARLLRSRLQAALRKKKKLGSHVDLLGCSIEHLRQYLQSLFLPGMSWSNHGEWHIDHIRPLSSFNLEDPLQLAAACYYKNLRPLWAKDNLVKYNKLTV